MWYDNFMLVTEGDEEMRYLPTPMHADDCLKECYSTTGCSGAMVMTPRDPNASGYVASTCNLMLTGPAHGRGIDLNLLQQLLPQSSSELADILADVEFQSKLICNSSVYIPGEPNKDQGEAFYGYDATIHDEPHSATMPQPPWPGCDTWIESHALNEWTSKGSVLHPEECVHACLHEPGCTAVDLQDNASSGIYDCHASFSPQVGIVSASGWRAYLPCSATMAPDSYNTEDYGAHEGMCLCGKGPACLGL
jgi:hypothetical protein